MLFPEFVTWLNVLLAWLSNGLWAYLIVRKSPKSLGNYKYLMLKFAFLGVLLGIIDITNQPMLHFYQGCYVIFSKNPLGLSRKLSFWYLALNSSCYAMTLSLLAFHFVYRFLAVCKPSFLYIFTIPHSLIPTGIFVLVTVEWLLSSIILAGESDAKTQYIKNSIYQHFGLLENEYTYVSTCFYRVDHWTGKEVLSMRDVAFVINISMIITTGFSIIIYCWLRIRQKLLHSHHSQRTNDMQNQLFRAFIIQTIFPVVLMFLPAGTLLFLPLFKLELGPSEGIILSLITTQPFIDAIVPMFFIPSYRNAIMLIFRKQRQVLLVRRSVEIPSRLA